MDLSRLSDDDLMALKAGDLSKVSTAGLMALRGESPRPDVGNVGFGKGLMMGAGRFVDRMASGAEQAFYKLTGDQQAQDDLAKQQAMIRSVYGQIQNKAPVSTAIGEAVFPAVASIPLTGGSGALGTIAKTAGAAAAPELLAYGTREEKLANAARAGAGGAIGAGIGVGITKALQPVTAATRAPQGAIDAADRLGVRLTAGEKTGNRALQALENRLASTPGYSGNMADFRLANQQAVNRAAARAVGENADEVGEAVLDAAKTRMSGEFARLNAAASPDTGGSQFMSALMKVDATNRALGPFAEPQTRALVDRGLDLAMQGKLSGEAYQTIRSGLGRQAQSAFSSGNNQVGDALKTIQQGLDDAANASLSAADQKALATVRKQYAAFKTLTKGQVSEAGNVSAPRLASALRQTAPDKFRTGNLQSELMDIARLGEGIKGYANPNSASSAALADFAANPSTLGLLMAGGNRLVGGAYMSRPAQAYLSGGLLTPGLEQLMLRGSAPVGLLGSSAYFGGQ